MTTTYISVGNYITVVIHHHLSTPLLSYRCYYYHTWLPYSVFDFVGSCDVLRLSCVRSSLHPAVCRLVILLYLCNYSVNIVVLTLAVCRTPGLRLALDQSMSIMLHVSLVECVYGPCVPFPRLYNKKFVSLFVRIDEKQELLYQAYRDVRASTERICLWSFRGDELAVTNARFCNALYSTSIFFS